jgi:endonuclease/exonuclease/phosphatase family metal-dependent hydrolase
MLEDTEGLDLNLRILTQNVRYADDPNNNSVAERKSRFKALVDEYKPDLIGTQEVTLEWYEYLSAMENYEVVGKSKTGSTSGDPDWNLVIYNKDRFVLMDSDTFWLTDTPDVVSKVEGASGVRICTWAELFDRYTGETIIMANTHIDHKKNTVRVTQAQLIRKHLRKRLGERFLECRVYLTGDFNCTVDSSPYNIIEDGGFVDPQKVALEDTSTVNGTYHGYNGQEYMFDYCFFRGEDTVLHYEIVSKNYIGEMDTEPGFVSDHYGVFVVFERKAAN